MCRGTQTRSATSHGGGQDLEGNYQNQYLQSFFTTFNHSNGFSGAIESGRFPVHAMTFARLAVPRMNSFSSIFHMFSSLTLYRIRTSPSPKSSPPSILGHCICTLEVHS